jgi:NADH:ubiquinone oxidoreductase subunit 3 (subunit A)
MSTMFVFLIFIPILVGVLLILNLLLAPHMAYSEKVEIYECGFHPVGEQTRSAFNIQFFLIGLLFMVFDAELILFTPVVLSVNNVEMFGLTIAIIFFALLTLGFVYEIGKGALNMKNIASLSKNGM